MLQVKALNDRLVHAKYWVRCFAAMLLGACSSDSDRDDWINFHVADPIVHLSSDRDWTRLEAERVIEVSAAMRPSAIAKLMNHPWVALTEEDLRKLELAPIEQVASARPFLIRAVKKKGSAQPFSVFTKENSVAINHEALGKHEIYEKSAVVVFLKRDPTELFVEASLAE